MFSPPTLRGKPVRSVNILIPELSPVLLAGEPSVKSKLFRLALVNRGLAVIGLESHAGGVEGVESPPLYQMFLPDTSAALQ